MSFYRRIVTHPGSAHKDDFLACCLLVALNDVAIERREPTECDLEDPHTAVVDVGGLHNPERGNFDHHQFPADHAPVCSLSLVLQHLGLYEDAREFCDWLEVAEWFDTRGPVETAAWLGVERELLARLNSTLDLTLLRRFASMTVIEPKEAMHEVMKWVGGDLLGYLRSMRDKLLDIGRSSQIWKIEGRECTPFYFLFLPRLPWLPEDASAGLARYARTLPPTKQIVGMIYPDRRGAGYALCRYNDYPGLDFTRVASEADVHFAHARGFVAKTSATSEERLRSLLQQSLCA